MRQSTCLVVKDVIPVLGCHKPVMQQSSGTDITSKEIPNATLVIMQWYHFLATLRIPLAKSRLIFNARLLIVHQTK